MTVQQQQVRKTNRRQAKVVYLAFSDDLTKTFNLCGKDCSDLPSRVSSESAIHKTDAQDSPYSSTVLLQFQF